MNGILKRLEELAETKKEAISCYWFYFKDKDTMNEAFKMLKGLKGVFRRYIGGKYAISIPKKIFQAEDVCKDNQKAKEDVKEEDGLSIKEAERKTQEKTEDKQGERKESEIEEKIDENTKEGKSEEIEGKAVELFVAESIGQSCASCVHIENLIDSWRCKKYNVKFNIAVVYRCKSFERRF